MLYLMPVRNWSAEMDRSKGVVIESNKPHVRGFFPPPLIGKYIS